MTKSFKISDLRYKLLIVFKKMSVSQQKLFNYEYKIALRWDMTEKSPLDLEKNIVNHLGLTEMVGYNCFIIFQYHYLNIKILKFHENWKFYHFEFFLKFWNFEIFWKFLTLNLFIFYNFEIFWKFWNFLQFWKILTFFVYWHEYQITAHLYGFEFHQ